MSLPLLGLVFQLPSLICWCSHGDLQECYRPSFRVQQGQLVLLDRPGPPGQETQPIRPQTGAAPESNTEHLWREIVRLPQEERDILYALLYSGDEREYDDAQSQGLGVRSHIGKFVVSEYFRR